MQTLHRIGATTHDWVTHLSRCAGKPRRTTAPSCASRRRPVIPIRRRGTPSGSRPHAVIGITRGSEQSRLCRPRHNLDLLFFHRGLNCLVAIELKVGRFEPEYLGKLAFYVEALDRDVKKPHENPAIGVLLCASKDDEVVEYALSRTASPALIAEYQTQLPDKVLLQAKLHEFWLAGQPDS